jgi:hypothetical protein
MPHPPHDPVPLHPVATGIAGPPPLPLNPSRLPLWWADSEIARTI